MKNYIANNTVNNNNNKEEITMSVIGEKLSAAFETVGGKNAFLASVEAEKKEAEIDAIAAAIADAVVGALRKVAVKAAHKLVKAVRPFANLFVKAAKAAETADWKAAMALWGVKTVTVAPKAAALSPDTLRNLQWLRSGNGSFDYFVFDLQRFCADDDTPALNAVSWGDNEALKVNGAPMRVGNLSKLVFCEKPQDPDKTWEAERKSLQGRAKAWLHGEKAENGVKSYCEVTETPLSGGGVSHTETWYRVKTRDDVFYDKTVVYARTWVGAGAFVGRQVSVTWEVGQIITGYNPTNTILIYCLELARLVGKDPSRIFVANLADSRKADPQVQKLARVIRDYFTYTCDHGTDKEEVEKQAYVTPLEYRKDAVTGQDICYVTPESAKEVFARMRQIPRNLPLDQVIQCSYDMGAVKRLYGEGTIDGDKKPDPKILEGIFGFDILSAIKQRGKSDVKVELAYENDEEGAYAVAKINGDVLEQKGDRTADAWFSASKSRNDGWGGNALSFSCINEESGRFFLEDFVQNIRLPLFRLLAKRGVRLATELNDMASNFKLPEEEAEAVNNVVGTVGETARSSLIASLQSCARDWWAVNTLFRIEADEDSNDPTQRLIAKSAKDEMREEKNLLFQQGVSNKVRLLFEAAGVNNPVDRVRLVFSAIGKMRNDCVVNAIGFMKSAIPEELLLWVLNVDETKLVDNRTGKPVNWNIVRETCDRVTLTGPLASMPVEKRVQLDGKKVTFDRGVLFFKGREVAMADESLNGVFTLRVDELDGEVTAHCPIKDLVTVPAADPDVLYVRLGKSQDPKDIENALDTIVSGDMRFGKDHDGNTVIVDDETNVIVAPYNGTINCDNVNTILFTRGLDYDPEQDAFVGKPYQAKGDAAFVKDFNYKVGDVTWYSAFVLFKDVTASNRKWR